MASEHSTESVGEGGASRRPLVAGIAILAVAVVLILGFRFLGGALLAGDGGRTPEALFEDLRELGSRGDWLAAWTRVHPDEQTEFRRAIDESRVFYDRNPGARKLATEPYQCSYQEYLTLPHRELYARAAKGWEVLLTDARVVRLEDAPDVPGDMFVHWRSSFGEDETMRARQGGDGLWYVMKIRN